MTIKFSAKLTRRLCAAPVASAGCSENIEAAMAPDPNELSGLHATFAYKKASKTSVLKALYKKVAATYSPTW